MVLLEAGEMAQHLKILAALAEEPGSQHCHGGTQVSVIPMLVYIISKKSKEYLKELSLFLCLL